MEEYKRGPIACEWCGNVRNKKVVIAGSDGSTLVACRKHFQKHDGSLVNDVTVDAIIRLRAHRT